jgi:hypothetical protein
VFTTVRFDYRNLATAELLVAVEHTYGYFFAEDAVPTGRSAGVPPLDRERRRELPVHAAAEPLAGGLAFDHLDVGHVIASAPVGPVTVDDVALFHVGWGTGGPYAWGTRPAGERMRLAGDRGFWSTGRTGVKETALRIHWEAIDNRRGTTRPHLYGQQQSALIVRTLTELAGEGWLRRFVVFHRRPSYLGQTLHTVATIERLRPPNTVELDVALVDEEGYVHAEGSATVLVPSAAEPLPGPTETEAP